MFLIHTNRTLLLSTNLLTNRVTRMMSAYTTCCTSLISLSLISIKQMRKRSALRTRTTQGLTSNRRFNLTQALSLSGCTTRALRTLLTALSSFMKCNSHIANLRQQGVNVHLYPRLLICRLSSYIFIRYYGGCYISRPAFPLYPTCRASALVHGPTSTTSSHLDHPHPPTRLHNAR